MATITQLEQALINADAAGDVEAAKVLASEIRKYRSSPTDIKKQAAVMALDGMSNTDKFFAGMGKRFSDIATLGMRDEPSSDAALMESGYAQAGGAGADLTTLLGGGSVLRGLGMLTKAPKLVAAGEALAMPNTALKAGLTGGAYSAATENGDAIDRARSGAVGTVAGAAVPLATTLYRGGKALVEPLTKSGQQAIAGRTLRRFAGDNADNLSVSLANPEVFVPGSIPTVAEASGNAGLAALQQGLSNVDKGGFGNALAQRQAANRAARVQALQNIAGDDAAMAAAMAARDNATDSLYNTAKQKIATGDATFDALLNRPLIQDGAKFAKDVAENEGRTFALTSAAPAKESATGVLDLAGNPIVKKIAKVDATYSGQTLHDLKLGIDKAFTTDAKTGAARRAGASEIKAKKDFLNWLEAKIPEYGLAREEFERLSKPINQMTIGKELMDKLRPALADFGANTRETAATFAKSLRDADATAAKATGFAKAKMADIMTADQMAAINGVANDLARKANADDLIRGIGSNTAQNLATQNALRQAFGPLGLPETWAESAVMQTMFKPLSMIYNGVGEARIADQLGAGLLDPKYASALMQLKSARPKINGGLLDYVPSASIAILPQFAQ